MSDKMSLRIFRRFSFQLIIVALVVLCFEAGSIYLSITSKTGIISFYSHETRISAKFQDQRETYFRFLNNQYDGLTGWRNPRSFSRKTNDCTGKSKTYSYDALGARRGGGGEEKPETVGIIALGDSFTHGGEANDVDTFPAKLSRLTGIRVANHGVGGFGPLQAVLRFEQMAPSYPNARIALLGIMYENIRRIPNSYFPVYYKEIENIFTFKPHMALGDDGPYYVANANGPKPLPFDRLNGIVKEAFQKDFWAKHVARFPYSLSLITNLGSNYVFFKGAGKLSRNAGLPVFGFDYRNKKLLIRLTAVIKRFVKVAKSKGILPVIVFIPLNGLDRTSPDQFIAKMESELGEQTVFVNVGHAEIDWSIFNVRLYGCHPSTTGYEAIAREIYDALKNKNLRSGRESGGGAFQSFGSSKNMCHTVRRATTCSPAPTTAASNPSKSSIFFLH